MADIFSPCGSSVAAVVGDAGTRIVLPGSGGTVEIGNDGDESVFVRLGGADVVATPTAPGAPGSYPVQAGLVKQVARGGATHLALVCAGGLSTVVSVTVGDGR